MPSSRRSFIGTLSGLVASGTTPTNASWGWPFHRRPQPVPIPVPVPVPPEPIPAPTPAPTPGIRVRYDINSLAGQIESLKAGFARLKALPTSDGRSYQFQANMHGTLDKTPNDLWNQCQHETRLFFA